MFHSEILASINFNNNLNLVPWLGGQPNIEMLFWKFFNMALPRFFEKCRSNISKCCCSPIQGTMSSLRWRSTEKICSLLSTRIPCIGEQRYSETWSSIFQHPWYVWLCWGKNGTTFQCVVVLQSKVCRTNSKILFGQSRTFKINPLKCLGRIFVTFS